MDTLPVKEFRRLDLNSEELGVPVWQLMARAGKALADAVQRHAQAGPVLLLCGRGNNGGDGFAAAGILLRRGVETTVVLLEPAGAVRSDAARSYLEVLPEGVVQPWDGSRRSYGRAAIVVDCLLGSGIHGRPRPPYDAAIRWMNRQDAPIVSCDVPSGLGSDLAVRPAETVTFHAAKEGMTPENSGTITVAPIGIPARAQREVGLGDLAVGFRPSAPESHKGQNGRVLVVAGGPYLGAPYYVGMGAYRAGADLVHVVTPARAAAALRTWGPELLVHDACEGEHLVDGALGVVEPMLRRTDAVVVGPGLGTERGTREVARAVIETACEAGVRVVVDADGLDAVDGELLARWGGYMVLTPHGGEFSDLTGWKPTPRNVTRYAARHGVTVLRKGATDVVSDGDRTRYCTRGHPAMTVGGTGDLLAGVVAALLARGATPFDASCAGAYLVGCAGELAAGRLGFGMVTSDMTIDIARVLSRSPA